MTFFLSISPHRAINPTAAYDAENRVVAVCTQDTPATCQNQPGAGRTLYVYDGLGNRVQKKDSNGNAIATYVYDAFGNLAAEYGGSTTASGTQYVSADALGSTRLVASGTSPTERHDFEPFGYEVASGGTWRANVAGYGVDTVRQKFTGQERDNESSLDFFNARYFDGIQGRFTSPDPDMAGANLADPQSWNAYAYVSGNPLTYTDPSGRFLCATCVGASTGNPAGVIIGGLIDLGGLLGGLFGFGGGHPPDLGPAADAIQPVTLQPSPDADWQEGPGGTMADDGSDLSGTWNERVPIRASGGPLNLGGVFGGGGSLASILGIQMPDPWVLSANPNLQIQSWYKVIQEHLEKIANDPNNIELVVKWRKDIAKAAGNILKKAQQVTKGRRADGLEKYLQRTIGTSVEDISNFLRTPIIVIDPCLLNPMLAGCRSRGPMM